MPNKSNWYCNQRPRQQVNLYKLFVEKKGISLDVLMECMENFALSKVPKRVLSNREEKYYHNMKRRDILDGIEWDFESFIKIVAEKTGITFKKRNSRDHYQEWYDEACMDGSLAYNNSGDDF